MSVNIETVRTGAFEMNFFRFGGGSKPFVILPGLAVQSVTLSAEAIAAAYGVMTGEYTVYVFDRRSALPAHYTVTDMAADTAGAIKALGLRDIALFGASQGGMIAMKIAADHPDLVSALVLGSTTARVSGEAETGLGKWISLAEKGDREGLYLAFGESVYPEETFKKYRAAFLFAARLVTGADLERFAVLAKGTFGFDATADLKKIVCPALILGASDDAVVGPDAAAGIAEGLKGNGRVELYVYGPGYGHAAYDTAPDYKQRILEFLRKTN